MTKFKELKAKSAEELVSLEQDLKKEALNLQLSTSERSIEKYSSSSDCPSGYRKN